MPAEETLDPFAGKKLVVGDHHAQTLRAHAGASISKGMVISTRTPPPDERPTTIR
jgi:hypothetical protein